MTTAAQPLVTIITPTYNTGSYLEETITSVLQQTYSNIEYFVIDDGSTDNTSDILGHYQGRLFAIAQENRGEPRSVNRGFSLATGDYVIVVNADDPVKPSLVAESVAFMEQHPDVLVGYPGWDMIDSRGKVLLTQPMYDYDYDIMLRWHYCVAGPGAIMRRAVLALEQGRDESFRYTGDYEFWLRVGLHGNFALIPANLATWRYHKESTTVAVRSRGIAEEHVRLIQKLYSRKDLPRQVRSGKAEAMSSALLVAGSILLESDPAEALRYIRRSVYRYPFAPERYPTGLARPRHLLLQSFLSVLGVKS